MKYFKEILLGVFIGLLFTFSSLGIIAFLLFLLCVYYLKNHTNSQESKFLIKILIAGFLLRVILSILNYSVGLLIFYHAADTQPDAIIYNSNAFYVANVLRGFNFCDPIIKEPFLIGRTNFLFDTHKGGLPPFGSYQFKYFTYLIGLAYSWLGYSPLALKFINSLFGCIGAVLVYFIAKILTKSEKVSRISLALAMFFPSLIYWSASLHQDTLINFIFLFYILSILIYLRDNTRISFLSTCALFLILCLFKIKIFLLFASGFILIIVMKFFQGAFKRKNFIKLILAFSILLALGLLVITKYSLIGNLLNDNFIKILKIHQYDFKFHPQASVYKIYKDALYQKDIIDLNDFLDFSLVFSVFKALVYYVFSPFPWRIPYGHPLLLLFFPQSIFIFISIPFFLKGLFVSVKNNFFITISLLLLLSLLIIPQAMAEAVVGTVVRHRDMFTPFWIIYAAYGFYLLLLKNNRDEIGIKND